MTYNVFSGTLNPTQSINHDLDAVGWVTPEPMEENPREPANPGSSGKTEELSLLCRPHGGLSFHRHWVSVGMLWSRMFCRSRPRHQARSIEMQKELFCMAFTGL